QWVLDSNDPPVIVVGITRAVAELVFFPQLVAEFVVAKCLESAARNQSPMGVIGITYLCYETFPRPRRGCLLTVGIEDVIVLVCRSVAPWISFGVNSVGPRPRRVISVSCYRVGSQAVVMVRGPGWIRLCPQQAAAIVAKMLIGTISHPVRQNFAETVVCERLRAPISVILLGDRIGICRIVSMVNGLVTIFIGSAFQEIGMRFVSEFLRDERTLWF